MLKVMLASRNEADNALLEKKLTPISRQIGAVRFNSARPANLNTMLDSQYSLLIFNCQHFNSAMRHNITQWRSLGYLGPIMVLVKIPDPGLIDQFVDMQNLTIIEKPYENKDLQGIAIKYLNDANVAQRRFRRFDTNQTANLESYNKNYSSNSRIQNISKGGAYIVGDLQDLSKGDLLRVSFELNELKKNRTMSAEVVWTSGEVGNPDRAAGLKFVAKATIYEALLNAA